MRKLLIIKTGAAGDVVRTTVVLHLFKDWEVDWLVAEENKDLVSNEYVRNVFVKSSHINPGKIYDLVLNLEDDEDISREVLSRIKYLEIAGTYIADGQQIRYTSEMAEWFDMGLISRYGIAKANELKLRNRSSYQEIIYRSLGYTFEGQEYIMPKVTPVSELSGDIAIAPKAGNKWPIKAWHYFEDLGKELSKTYEVNILPMRSTILEHVADINQHRFLISPDSLPMHIALGLKIPCVAIFTCTSPWEIHDYRLLTKIVSPKLELYFYKRGFIEDAVKCISYLDVHKVIKDKLSFHHI